MVEESPAADGQQRTMILPEIWGREGRCWQTLVVIAQGRGREAAASNAFRQLALQAASARMLTSCEWPAGQRIGCCSPTLDATRVADDGVVAQACYSCAGTECDGNGLTDASAWLRLTLLAVSWNSRCGRRWRGRRRDGQSVSGLGCGPLPLGLHSSISRASVLGKERNCIVRAQCGDRLDDHQT